MEAMRTTYPKSGTQSQHVSHHMQQTIPEGTWVLWKESTHRWRTFYFAESFDEPGGNGAFEVRHSFPFFRFVGTHLRNFVRRFLVHLR